MAVADILSGELDGLLDALITCVAPMDGTRSKSLVEYMEHLPPRFRDLGYAVKTLPSGNQVVDGKVMSWVYKLKSMEKESALAPLDYIEAEVTVFPKGHGAIATSWSYPASECCLIPALGTTTADRSVFSLTWNRP